MTEADVIQPSASIASTGKGIRYIGQHCFAMMTPLAASTSSETQLSFTVGAGYIVGRFTMNGSADPTSTDAGNITVWTVKFNGQAVAVLKTESATEDMPTTVYNEVIIPPFTLVEVTSQSNGNSPGRLISALFTGRVYGAT